MSKCLVLIGSKATGKTSLARFLELNGWKRIVTYTTRLPTPKEADGVDHHFITHEQFHKLKNKGFFAETTSMNNHLYGSAKTDYYNYDKKVVILPVTAALKLTIPTYIVHLNLSRAVIRNRLLKQGYSFDEIMEQLAYDEEMFKKIEFDDLCDLEIIKEMPINQLANEIIKGYSERKGY